MKFYNAELAAALPHFSSTVLNGWEELNMAFIGKDLLVWKKEPSDFACRFFSHSLNLRFLLPCSPITVGSCLSNKLLGWQR